ncbi:MAG: hypothetical protein H6741_09080 [Alphaproteobacteria bacterium]|nr:hypothetical protein [Alphaproteobacteria bacterium]
MDTTSSPAGLSALHFMIGRWRIEGEQAGAPVRGHAEVRLVCGGAFLEYRETILDEAGAPAYEDLCVYGFSQETLDLFVTHFQAPDHAARHPVLPIRNGGFNWVPKEMEGPWLRLLPGEVWRIELWWLDAEAPDLILRFHPVEAG